MLYSFQHIFKARDSETPPDQSGRKFGMTHGLLNIDSPKIIQFVLLFNF